MRSQLYSGAQESLSQTWPIVVQLTMSFDSRITIPGAHVLLRRDHVVGVAELLDIDIRVVGIENRIAIRAVALVAPTARCRFLLGMSQECPDQQNAPSVCDP